MSRQPTGEPETQASDMAEDHIAFMSSHALPKAITREELVAATQNDEELAVLIEFLRGTQTKNNTRLRDVKAKYEKILSELCVSSDGIVMRGTCILLPYTLQDRAIRTAHEGHQGRSKTKSLLRTKVWFAKMDIKVDEVIDQCQLLVNPSLGPLILTK